MIRDVPPDEVVEIARSARRELVGRFERWLDAVLANEPPPSGIDAAILASVVGDDAAPDDSEQAGRDRVALFAALTALVEESRLQGRAFKQLAEAVALLTDRGRDERTASHAGDVWLDVLLDLYARLERGREMCRRAVDDLEAPPQPRGPGLLARLRPERRRRGNDRSAVEALQEGYALGLDRLVDALADHGIAAFGAVGEPFDHHTMTAVDAVRRAGTAEPTVLEVHTPGFRRHGEVLRLAKVKVASGTSVDLLETPRRQEEST